VISANFESREIHDDSEKLYKSARPRSIEVAWTDHQNLVDKFRSEGKQRKHEVCFDDYLELVRREDSYMLRPGEETKRAT